MNGNAHTLRGSGISVETPEGIEFILYPAGILVRICAVSIDTLLQWFLMLLSAVITNALRQESYGGWFTLLLSFALNWFYFVAWEVFNRGQSLGKYLMGIRVVQSNGSPVRAPSSFMRNLLRFADTFLSLYAIGLVCVAASPGFRRIGDWAADTLVVYASRSLPPPVRPRAAWLEQFPAITPPRALSYAEKQVILMFARRYPLLGHARAEEIAGDFVNRVRGDRSEGGAARYLLGIARKIGGGIV
ncbi:MAG: RDD family protein [Spirochaetaceae bacterium]|jgi:uncharacterized RDD family membrane protein YckC|nr:RDD family protein [Spirochaetaceae bacterium]